MTARIAVVGAGVAGAAAAYALRDADASVTVFERSGAVGGRAATRTRDGCTYDYGANYVKNDDDRVSELVTDALADELVDAAGPVWTFDERGAISEGQDADEHKWTGRRGIATIADRLLERSGATLRTGAPVTRVRCGGTRGAGDESGWTVTTADDRFDGWDGVVLTPPAPRTAALLADGRAAAAIPDSDIVTAELLDALASVPYRRILSVALHYPFRLDRPYYALVNTDRAHEIGWLAREECKPGHVPDGESLLIVQLAPDWTARRRNDPAPAVVEETARLTADLLDDERLAEPDWTDHAWWDHALPDDGVDRSLLDPAADRGLWFAGDWMAGEARVHAALASGLETGAQIATAID